MPFWTKRLQPFVSSRPALRKLTIIYYFFSDYGLQDNLDDSEKNEELSANLNPETIDTPKVMGSLEILLPESIGKSKSVTIEVSSEPDDLKSSEQTSSKAPLLETVQTVLNAENISSKNSRNIPVAQLAVINYNDPQSWPKITDEIRTHLILNGPDQGKKLISKTLKQETGVDLLLTGSKKNYQTAKP